ncbi:ubiquitin carboxyl-terminal hydrolase [Fimicolochytrium jonesii]|uniref:ubiquitin carboxyl-terminal hydrolase n=1 Tax=Fimicolochytrium jonesii TaxID=1396493 RepID=UPI0022FEC962|nr:ubiquitin carboxyl-terminal hydrolase [Fimicolochytrium jonesii]KAI8821878.1 ubiquitin carboxyl-terminal hydrolase [Fimicolochytrium jonesii]
MPNTTTDDDTDGGLPSTTLPAPPQPPSIPPNELDVRVGDPLEASPWSTIESDPAVFTELAAKIGIKGVQVEEIFSMDEGSFDALGQIYGLIFLFRWQDADTEESAKQPGEKDGDGLFFLNQVVENACATQALVSIALNCSDVPGIDIGDELRRFKEFTRDFSPAMRGLALVNSHALRTAHNSFARQTDLPVLNYPIPENHTPKSKKRKHEEDEQDPPYHFISYLMYRGSVWEVDGLKRWAKRLGAVGEGQGWVGVALGAVRERMKGYENDAVEFNLMAVTHDRLLTLTAEHAEQTKVAEEMRARLDSLPTLNDEEREAMVSTLRIVLAQCDATQRGIEALRSDRERSKAENIRRRFNYGPFIKRYLELLHKKDLLAGVLES